MELAITSEIGQLQRTVESLRLKLGKIAEKLDERGNYFVSKSDKWQDSEKGIEYNSISYELENKRFMFEEQIESLESVIEELESIKN